MTRTLAQLLLAGTAALAIIACTPSTDGASDRPDAVETADIKVPERFTLVERYTGEGEDVAIPYEKYELDNGLTVVLHQDDSDPLVHVDVTYHVGSGREDIGKSGFAHFFEHMLFQGSENVEDEQHFKLITESGGTLNGSTNSDRTNYYQTVPANQLERMLWLEADRMGYVLNAVTQESFDTQREVVKNERGQRVDNQPYGLLSERVGEAMYPEGHPYSWSVIGYMEDLDRADLDDLKRFFMRWYGPNNAVLTIGGDFDREETLEMVRKYFGSIPRGADVEPPQKLPVSLDADRYISLEDNVQLPLIYMAWPTVSANHPDEAPLDVLQDIMGGGQTSLLYKNLEKPGLAVNTFAGHACRELHCQFTTGAVGGPTTQSLADLETVIRDSLTEFEERGVQDDDLERTKASIVSGLIYGLESVPGKVRQLAAYETYRDTPNGISRDVERYSNVTKADVMRVYEQYIKDKPAVVMSIVPKGKPEMIARADTWERYERTIPESEPMDAFEWSLPEDDFDRSVVPAPGKSVSIKAPDVYRGQVGSIPLIGTVNSEVPTTVIEMRLRTGQMNEPLDKLGLAELTAQMLGEATTTMSAEDRSNALAKLGSNVSTNAGDVYSSIDLRSLSSNLDETVRIAVDTLRNPKFDQADFDRVKAIQLAGIEANKKQAGLTATNLFNRLAYGPDQPYANANTGTAETVGNITLDDVRAFYAANYSPSVSSILVVSNLGQDAIEDALSPLADWAGEAVDEVKLEVEPAFEPGTIYFVDKPGAAQSEIRLGKPSLAYDPTGKYYRAVLMNYPLGGAFNSRINLNLREDKSYTYGARGSFIGQQDRGQYRAQAGVRTDVTTESLTEFMKEIELYHESGPTQEEVDFTKAAIGQGEARSYETPRQKLALLRRMDTYGLDAGYIDEQKDILANFTEAQADALAAELLDLDEMFVVIVGDKATQMEKLETLGLPIVEVDADGNPVD